MQQLCRYHWPGNIRELENVIAGALINLLIESSEGGEILPRHLPPKVVEAGSGHDASTGVRTEPDSPRVIRKGRLELRLHHVDAELTPSERAERDVMIEVILEAGSFNKAAPIVEEKLDSSRPTFQKRLTGYGVEVVHLPAEKRSPRNP